MVMVKVNASDELYLVLQVPLVNHIIGVLLLEVAGDLLFD